jgi:hypothetical protein
MRKVRYSDLLKRSAERGQRSYSELSSDDAEFLEAFIDSRLRAIWEKTEWTDLMRIEERTFKQPWAAGSHAAGSQLYDRNADRYVVALKTTSNAPSDSDAVIHSDWGKLETSYTDSKYVSTTDYAVGDKVYYYVDDKIYQLHTDVAAGTVPTNASYWGELPLFDKYIALEQSWETTDIGTATSVWDKNRKLDGTATNLRFFLSHNGVQCPGEATKVWLEFRAKLPDTIHTTYYDAGTTYYTGDVVRYRSVADNSVFDLYTAVLNSFSGIAPTVGGDNANWELVAIPHTFRDYITHGSAADLLKHDEKQEIGIIEEQQAQAALVSQLDVQERQSQQNEFFNVRTYSHGNS